MLREAATRSRGQQHISIELDLKVRIAFFHRAPERRPGSY
jgi:hypothetical protein